MNPIVERTARRLPARLVVAAAGVALLAVLATWIATRVASGNICPDFVQMWTAALLLASGNSPYDSAMQAAVQHGLGWSRQIDGLGLYDFLPYYYPPWLGLTCIPLLPFGYRGAQVAWMAVNTALLVAAALLARNGTRDTRSSALLVLVLAFAPCVLVLLMGQVSVMVLAAAILAWRLLEQRFDAAGGAVLAWLTVKPQLTIPLLVALLVWCSRRGRWRAVGGFFAAFAALVLVATALLPEWPIQMAMATRVTRLPTDVFPATGTTVFTLLEMLGLRGAPLWAGYLLVAIPIAAIVVRLALSRSSRLEHVVGLALIAPFFVSPYARHYDFPILLVPAVVLVGECRPAAAAALLAALLGLPYVHLALFSALAGWLGIAVFPGPQFTFLWMPVLIACAWFLTVRASGSTQAGAHACL